VRQADLRTSIRPTVAEIDLEALRANALRVRALVGGVGVWGVVKADAYGHGAIEVARALEPLCEVLAVSLVEEGLELRDAGIECPIIVLGAYFGDRHSDVVEAGLIPVVSDVADLERFAAAPARRSFRARGPESTLTAVNPPEVVDVHLKVDTGMSRLGVAMDELPAVIERVKALSRVRLRGVCTHFASADVEDAAATWRQLDRFRSGLASLRASGIEPDLVHAANSAAALRFEDTRFSAVRPGLALYGALPSPFVSASGLTPVLSLRSRIMSLRLLPAGTSVSYGGQFTAARPTRVATIPIGYADGYPRHVRGAQVLVRGARAPIVGAVCMDMLMVDVTDVLRVQVDDVVTLIGADGPGSITLDELAGWAGTLNYEILCGLSKRVPRLYRGRQPALPAPPDPRRPGTGDTRSGP
jgi:alanine racemase